MIVFIVLLVIYITAQLNAPKKFDWMPTLRNRDKNPYGAVVVYNGLKQLFPRATISSERKPIYNVLHEGEERNSAYVVIAPSWHPGKTDIEELLKYVHEGNTAFLSAFDFDEHFLDTLGLKHESFAAVFGEDSTSINFVNPVLKSTTNYRFLKSTIDGYFRKIKKADSTLVLGINQDSLANFVRVQYGEGYFFVHAAPLCFSNYFMLYGNNNEYSAKALSYIPSGVSTIHWDEYSKSGREGAETPLRFFLSNLYLKWALYLTIAALLLYVFFEMKRRQRIIPLIDPLRNSTLDYVETVSSVYFSRHDNSSIALKKIQFWFDHIRTRYYLSTQEYDESFVLQLERKSGVSKELIGEILQFAKKADAQSKVSDDLLMKLCSAIDEFYRLSKI